MPGAERKSSSAGGARWGFSVKPLKPQRNLTQTHLRTTLPRFGQVETDEIYIGLDKRGAHYVFPVQAKGGNDLISVVQIEQDIAVCAAKFPALICRPIAAQFMADDFIALFELEEGEQGIAISSERHYRLVPGEEVTTDDLKVYRRRQD